LYFIALQGFNKAFVLLKVYSECDEKYKEILEYNKTHHATY